MDRFCVVFYDKNHSHAKLELHLSTQNDKIFISCTWKFDYSNFKVRWQTARRFRSVLTVYCIENVSINIRIMNISANIQFQWHNIMKFYTISDHNIIINDKTTSTEAIKIILYHHESLERRRISNAEFVLWRIQMNEFKDIIQILII